MNAEIQQFEVDIESDLEAGAFSRVLATLVNGSPAFLARVVVGGTVVYPAQRGSLYDELTVRVCEFRTRDNLSTLDEDTVAAILRRIHARFPLPAGRPIRADYASTASHAFVATTATNNPAGRTDTSVKPARSA